MAMPRYRGLLLAVALVGVLGLTATLVACQQEGGRTPQPGGTPPVATESPEPQTMAEPVEATPNAAPIVTLTVWTTEAFSPTQAITTGQILAQQLAIFQAAQPQARVQFVLKKPYGKTGILDYLLTTATVVPEMLPDLVVIDVDELDDAVQAELVQPLDELLPADLMADLFPFASEACTLDGRLYGLQFEADLDHLVYNSQVPSPPHTWGALLNQEAELLLPAGGQSGLVNDIFWGQYLAVQAQTSQGGSAAEEGPILDEDSLIAVLQFYRDCTVQRILPPATVDYHTTDECWADFLAGQAAMSVVSAHRYLADGSEDASSIPAAIPAIDGPAAAISRGWALALISQDPDRQAVAVRFLVQWMTPEINAVWNQAALTLPTRQAALALWAQPVSDRYVDFIGQQLVTARPRPRLGGDPKVAAALQGAVEAVMSGALTPEEAAAQVMDNVQ